MDRLAIWVLDSGGPKEAQVQSYVPGGANVHKLNRIHQVEPMYRTTLCRKLGENG